MLARFALNIGMAGVWLILLISLPAASLGNLHFERLALTGENTYKNDNISAVRATIKDKRGFIWFGGENGLGRYDGQELVIYQTNADNPRSISGNFVWALALDHEGVLWIGTGRGLNRYNAASDDFDRFMADPAAEHALGSNSINALAIDQDNNLIVAAAAAVSILNPQRTHFHHYYPHRDGIKSVGNNLVRTLFIDNKNQLWAGTSNSGLNLFNRQTGTFTRYQHDPQDPSSLISNDVASIAQDHLGQLWVGTYSNGLSRMNADGKTFTHYQHDPENIHSLGSNNIAAIRADSLQKLWIATDHGGLNLYQPDSDSFRRFTHSPYDIYSLSSNHPRHIFEDDQTNLWIGMFPTGVNFLDQSAAAFTNYSHKPDDPASLSNNGLLTFMEDSEGVLWIGTEDGLNAFDRNTYQFMRYFSNTPGTTGMRFGAVLSLEEDASGELWVGTWSGGLYRFNKQTGKIKHYLPDKDDPQTINSAFIWKILRDKDNTIWLGTETGGLNRYDPGTDSFTSYTANPNEPDSLINNQIWTLLEDRRGFIWVGTLEGLDRFDKNTETFTHFLHDPDDTTTISSNQIISLLEDSRGNLWVGTRDAGINIYDPETGNFTHINVNDGLPSATISSIVEDDKGNIWVTTVNGIARIDSDTRAITVFNRSHGLISNNFNRDATFKDRHGNLYVGSIAGFSVFHPDDVAIESTPPPVVITRFKLLGKTVPINGPDKLLPQSITETTELTLDYHHIMFSFDFAALSYRSPAYNEYAYMLEGFDTDWHYIGNQRTATYTNINPGRYIFRVKAANRDGVWNENGAAIAIVITPPLWRTWWAYLGYALLFVTVMAMLNKYKNLRIKSNIYRILSATDPLTGTSNRAGMAQVAEEVFAKRTHQASVGLLVIDIDHFKRINDIRGHDSGDRVLKEFAALINATIRLGDSFARWGGEEFVLLCPHSHREGITALAEKIRRVVAEHCFEQDYAELHITVSIGAACATADESFETLFKRADMALYEAKAAGRNRVIFAV